MSELLNHKIQGSGQPVVLIHGLFGSLDNLGLVARGLEEHYQVISLDLRNHGRSFHRNTHTYQEQAQDVLALLEHLNIQRCSLVGHSMGGKVAMKIASLAPQRVEKLAVMDMAPVAYTTHNHDNVFAGLKSVISHQPTSRMAAMALLANSIEMEGVRQFLSKSMFSDEGIIRWRFNVATLLEQYSAIVGWQPGEPFEQATLFMKGANSDYILAEHQSAIAHQFPQAKAHIVANTGHWLHAEKPQDVIRVLRRFLQT